MSRRFFLLYVLFIAASTVAMCMRHVELKSLRSGMGLISLVAKTKGVKYKKKHTFTDLDVHLWSELPDSIYVNILLSSSSTVGRRHPTTGKEKH